jgi:hypothetical protein
VTEICSSLSSTHLAQFLAQSNYLINISIMEIRCNILFNDHKDLLSYARGILLYQCKDEEIG